MAVQKSDIEKIVGQGNVLDDEATLAAYSKDQSFVSARRPDLVAYVENGEQVQAIILKANETKTPVIPYSSGMNLHGATIPDQGGIMLDMSRMNKIISIDEENWYVIVEPGVTYQQLQDNLTEKGLRIMVPFGTPPQRSVLTSYLERDPVMAAPSFEHGNYLIMDTELVLPNGEIFRTGNWASGGDPGAPSGPIRNTLFRMFTAAQGTLGIMIKMVLQVEPIQKHQQLFFIPCNTLEEATGAVKAMQLREIGTECLILNSFNLAAMCADGWNIPEQFPAEASTSADFEAMRKELPPWVITVCINGNIRRAEEKIAYESEALKEVCDSVNLPLLENLPNVPGADIMMKNELLRPWSILKKFNYKGSVNDLTFKAPLKKAAELEKRLQELAGKHGYSTGDIGMFLLPLERGRAVHCEFDLHSPAECGDARHAVKALWLEASADLLNNGAYFDRPYGAWADMIYARAANYTQMLRKLKADTDPNNILNPGKLCFT